MKIWREVFTLEVESQLNRHKLIIDLWTISCVKIVMNNLVNNISTFQINDYRSSHRNMLNWKTFDLNAIVERVSNSWYYFEVSYYDRPSIFCEFPFPLPVSEIVQRFSILWLEFSRLIEFRAQILLFHLNGRYDTALHIYILLMCQSILRSKIDTYNITYIQTHARNFRG